MSQDTRLAELNLKIASQGKKVNSSPSKELAIVSPCSTCQNFQQSTSLSPDPYRSTCPRRMWIQQQAQDSDIIDGINPVLTNSGTDDPHTLANPAVDKSTGNYVVWVAGILDNQGIADPNGNQITPSILDPGFNNLYIRCKMYPYIPEDHHDAVHSGGTFQENDFVIAEEQPVPPIQTSYSQNQVPYIDTPIAGTVTKTSLPFKYNTNNPTDHALVGGC